MQSVFFWKEWPENYRNLWLALSGLLVFSFIFLWFTWFQGADGMPIGVLVQPGQHAFRRLGQLAFFGQLLQLARHVGQLIPDDLVQRRGPAENRCRVRLDPSIRDRSKRVNGFSSLRNALLFNGLQYRSSLFRKAGFRPRPQRVRARAIFDCNSVDPQKIAILHVVFHRFSTNRRRLSTGRCGEMS